MSSPEAKENLTKLSIQELEELLERQNNILKNKRIIEHLPDKGKQLQDKLVKVKIELQLRQDIKDIEGGLKILTIDSSNSDFLKEKHVQHICSIERSPKKERYKPFSSLVKKNKKISENPTQLITLTESITLLAEQAHGLPVELVKKKIEGTEIEPRTEEHTEHSDEETGEV